MNKTFILDVIKAALYAARPSAAIAGAIDYDAASDILSLRGRRFDLAGKKLYICGFGKCAPEMASGVYGVLGARVAAGLLLSYEPAAIGDRISILKSSHPLPDENTLLNSRRLVEFVESLRAGDFLICLVSGGGSSFFEIPAPGISFEDLIALNKEMLKTKMPIEEINTVRRAVSAVKGGKLLSHIKSFLITLAISDTGGSAPADIASGPTVPCVNDNGSSLSILKKYNISVPPGIISYLKSAPDGGLGNLRKFADQDSRGIPGESSNDKVCENLSDSAHQSSKDKIHGHSSDPAHKNSKNMIYEIISDNALFIETAAGLLEEKSGAKVYIRPGFMSGEEGGAAHFIDSLREIKKEYSKDFIFIAGGEIPVAAENKTGRGGRCQHFALEAMMRLKRDNLYGFKKITLAAFATDGLEAFTDAAGAVFDESDIRAASLDEIESSLRAADSYAYFQKNGGLIITGATGLNVNDAFMAFCF